MSDLRFKCSCSNCKSLTGIFSGRNCKCQICDYFKEKLGLVQESLSNESQCSCSTCKHHAPPSAEAADSECSCEVCECFSDSYIGEQNPPPEQYDYSDLNVIPEYDNGEYNIEDIEGIEDLEATEDVEDVEAVEDIEDVEYIEDVEDVEHIEDIEDIEGVEYTEGIYDTEEMNDGEYVEDVDVDDMEYEDDVYDVQRTISSEVKPDELEYDPELDKQGTSISCDCLFKICTGMMDKDIHKDAQSGPDISDMPIARDWSREVEIDNISFGICAKDVYVQTSITIMRPKPHQSAPSLQRDHSSLRDHSSVKFNGISETDDTDPLSPSSKMSTKLVCTCDDCHCIACKGTNGFMSHRRSFCDCGISTCDCNDDRPTAHQIRFYNQATYTDDHATKEITVSTSVNFRDIDGGDSCNKNGKSNKSLCSKNNSKHTLTSRNNNSSKHSLRRQGSSHHSLKNKKKKKNNNNSNGKKCNDVGKNKVNHSFLCDDCSKELNKKKKKNPVKKKKVEPCGCEVCTRKKRFKK